MLKRIVSGAQTGADQGALIAAKAAGYETGGEIPLGFLTEDGPRPDLAKEFGIIESRFTGYIPRTIANVKNSDGTLRLAGNFESPGEIVTLDAIKQHNKPYLDVNVYFRLEHEKVARWIHDNKIEVLNIAGNRESKCPGIQEFTENFLTQVFERLQYIENLEQTAAELDEDIENLKRATTVTKEVLDLEFTI